MNDSFWNPFAIKRLQLVDQMKILEQHRAVFSSRQRVLVVSDRSARIRGETTLLLLTVSKASRK
jgi:hypothetical protein